MDFTSFFIGVGSTILLFITIYAYLEFKDNYIVLSRSEYNAIMREALCNARKVRKLVVEDI